MSVLLFRIERIDLVNAWSIANATANTNLIGACVPPVTNQFNKPITNNAFLCYTDIDYLIGLLTSLQEEYVTEEIKLRAIAAWMNAPTSTYELNIRAEHMEGLLQTLNLQRFSSIFMVDLAMNNVDLDLSNITRTTLLEMWKKKEEEEASALFQMVGSSRCADC